LTPYNNPALLLFAMATQPEYQVRWPVGQDQLLLVSVGTGMGATFGARGRTWLSRVGQLPGIFMNGASIGQDYLCRMGRTTAFGLPIDSEVGTVPKGNGLFTYVRYNADFGRLKELRTLLEAAGVDASELRALDAIGLIDRRKLAKLNSTHRIDELYRLGQLTGRLADVETHFGGFEPV